MDKENELEGLFEELVSALGKRLKSKDCSSTDLNTIRQFLRDNNITATSGRSHPGIRNLVDNLPYDESGDKTAH